MHFVLFCCLLFSCSRSFLGFEFIKCMRRFINFHSVDCCSCTGTMVCCTGLGSEGSELQICLYLCIFVCICICVSILVLGYLYISYMYTTVNFSGSGLREGSEQQTCLARWVARVVSMDGPCLHPPHCAVTRHTAQCTMHDIHCTRYKVQCIVHTGLNGRTLHKYVIQCTVNTYMPYIIVSMDGPWLHPPHSQCTSFT